MFSVWEALKNACLDCKPRFFLLFLDASHWSQHIWQRQKGCLQRHGELSRVRKHEEGVEDGCSWWVHSTKKGVNLSVSSQSVPGWAHPNSWSLLPCWCWVQFPLGSCTWSKDFVCPEGPNSKVEGISIKWSLSPGKAAVGLLWELYSVRQTIYHFLWLLNIRILSFSLCHAFTQIEI